ncbi:hypothetical protein [Ferroplasma sp.]|uniref:hypothetical protein n=1 Tax=Ferroplasma sp. TaxID=2591003 RepID=UPI00307EE8F4
MDSIDHEIEELYNHNKRISPAKFMTILLSVLGFNTAIIIASLYENDLLIRMILEILSGIVMTSFFVWFYIRFLRK